MSTDTTAGGLPYPLGDDPVTLGWQRIKELAEAVGRTMYAVKGTGDQSLGNAVYDWLGTANPWTLVGPPAPPEQFTYATSSGVTLGQGLQATVPGLFALTATVQFPYNATGDRALRILKNGAVIRREAGAADVGNRTIRHVSAVAYLDVGDRLGVQAYQSSGAPMVLYNGEDSRTIVMEYLGTAPTPAAVFGPGPELQKPAEPPEAITDPAPLPEPVPDGEEAV